MCVGGCVYVYVCVRVDARVCVHVHLCVRGHSISSRTVLLIKNKVNVENQNY